MSVFTSSGGSSTTTGSVSVIGSNSPVVNNIDMTLAATEYSFTLPDGCKQFLVKLRDFNKLQIAYIPGDSNITFLAVPKGCTYTESNLTTTGSLTLYFQSPAASQIAEIITWT